MNASSSRLLLALLSICLSVACSSEKVDLRPSNPVLVDLDGVEHRPLELAADELRVLIFITHDCPVANAYAPEVNRIIEEYSTRGVEFALVYVEPNVEREVLATHAREHELAGTLLLDGDHDLVDALGAEVTPEAFVLRGEANGYRVGYGGRIDDRNVAFGKKRSVPSQLDLRDALDALLAGEAVEPARTQAVGCYIE